MKYSAGACTECGKTSFIVSHKGGKEICGKCNKARLKALKEAKGINVPPKRKKPVKKLKKPKRKSIGWHKKEADRYFSYYIRLLYTDADGLVKCCTCNNRMHPKDIQNGHFAKRSISELRYSIINCHPQDYKCNAKHLGNGMKWLHGKYIDRLHGDGTADKLTEVELQNNAIKRSVADYEALTRHLKTEVAKLLIEKQIKAWW